LIIYSRTRKDFSGNDFIDHCRQKKVVSKLSPNHHKTRDLKLFKKSFDSLPTVHTELSNDIL